MGLDRPSEIRSNATQIPGFTANKRRGFWFFWSFGMILWHLASWHGLLPISSVRNTKHMMSLTVHLVALAATAPHLKRIWEGCPYGTRVRGLTAPQLNVRILEWTSAPGQHQFHNGKHSKWHWPWITSTITRTDGRSTLVDHVVFDNLDLVRAPVGSQTKLRTERLASAPETTPSLNFNHWLPEAAS